MNKVLFLLFLSLSLSAQVDFKGLANATVSDSFSDKRVNENCYGLVIQVNSNNANFPLKDVEISINGDAKSNIYKTAKDGKTLIITESPELSLIISGQTIEYISGTIDNLKLTKGKMKKLSIYLHQQREELLEKKPVIYLYSDKELSLNIALKPKADITFSYPAYKNGWNLKVLPGGEILADGKKYPYLFWEGNLWNKRTAADFKDGFVVKKEQTVSFLEEKLAFMGLNRREICDFITFWAPLLENREYNFIHFSCAEAYSAEVAELELSIKPDSEIRINMFFSAVDANFIVPEQQLKKFLRKGFTLVEWGGSELGQLP